MFTEYNIKLSIEAERDLQNVIIYIKNNLKDPISAERYAHLMKNEIESLKYNPKRYAIIDNKKIEDLQVRKLIIKNYIAFYRVNEEKKLVNIERILYGASNWMSKL